MTTDLQAVSSTISNDTLTPSHDVKEDKELSNSSEVTNACEEIDWVGDIPTDNCTECIFYLGGVSLRLVFFIFWFVYLYLLPYHLLCRLGSWLQKQGYPKVGIVPKVLAYCGMLPLQVLWFWNHCILIVPCIIAVSLMTGFVPEDRVFLDYTDIIDLLQTIPVPFATW